MHGVVVPLLHWLEVQAHAGSAVRHAGDAGKAFSTTIFSWWGVRCREHGLWPAAGGRKAPLGAGILALLPFLLHTKNP